MRNAILALLAAAAAYGYELKQAIGELFRSVWPPVNIGQICATLQTLEPGGRNELRTVNGNVTVTLEGEPGVELDASTSNSSVTCSLPILASSTGDNHLKETIGDGAAKLLVRTANASITLQ